MSRVAVRDRKQVDRRRWHRLKLAVPVQMSRSAAEKSGAVPLTMGQTVNLSAGGAYVTYSRNGQFTAGEILAMSITIPWEARRRMPFSRIAGFCRVVRVAERGDLTEVALAFCEDQLISLGSVSNPR